MRHLFDPRDGWPVVSTREFVGQLLTAVLIVATIVAVSWVLSAACDTCWEVAP